MKILKKNMIRGIHYFSTELKTRIDVIPRSCFNSSPAKLLANILNSFECLIINAISSF